MSTKQILNDIIIYNHTILSYNSDVQKVLSQVIYFIRKYVLCSFPLVQWTLWSKLCNSKEYVCLPTWTNRKEFVKNLFWQIKLLMHKWLLLAVFKVISLVREPIWVPHNRRSNRLILILLSVCENKV